MDNAYTAKNGAWPSLACPCLICQNWYHCTVAGTHWYEQPYGMANWDFDREAEALAAFRSRAAERLTRGYELREGALPEALT